jgi:hypothetical protein
VAVAFEEQAALLCSLPFVTENPWKTTQTVSFLTILRPFA